MWPTPDVGDILLCRFPQLPDVTPGPKNRPCIVLEVDDRYNPPRVLVCYGTSQHQDERHPGEFKVTKEDGVAFEAAGLSYDTKFALNARITIPYNDTWFALPSRFAKSTPKLGVMHASIMRRFFVAAQEAGLV